MEVKSELTFVRGVEAVNNRVAAVEHNHCMTYLEVELELWRMEELRKEFDCEQRQL